MAAIKAQEAISKWSFACISKRVFVRNHSYGNVFHLQVHFHANKTHLHMKGFARGFVLKQMHKVTRKWLIAYHLPAGTG